MKVLSKERIMGQNLVRYAKTERDVLSYTRHPFIVSLNAAFQTRTKLFLILDFCPGYDCYVLIIIVEILAKYCNVSASSQRRGLRSMRQRFYLH